MPQFCILITIVCLIHSCPPGSECRVCNASGEAYCVYSCVIDNGGCAEENQCAEVEVPACCHGQCCSPVNITCSGKCIVYTHETDDNDQMAT